MANRMKLALLLGVAMLAVVCHVRAGSEEDCDAANDAYYACEPKDNDPNSCDELYYQSMVACYSQDCAEVEKEYSQAGCKQAEQPAPCQDLEKSVEKLCPGYFEYAEDSEK